MEACGPTRHTFYVLDTNVLIHDPNALLNFEEHHVIIPMTVLEELDKLKSGKTSIAADCRQAIRLIDRTLADAPPELVEQGVPIQRGKLGTNGSLAILMDRNVIPAHCLPNDLNDNKIINQLCHLQTLHPEVRVALVSKDINMRLKARGCGIDAEDYHTDQLVDDIALLARGYHQVPGSFWDTVNRVETHQRLGKTVHEVLLTERIPGLHINDFIIDGQGFIGWVSAIDGDRVVLRDLHQEPLMHQEAWGLRPRDIFQALAMYALLDQDIHLVNLTGAAGSGKTILAQIGRAHV